MDHLESNNLLSPGQFGFRAGRSGVSSLLCYYDRVTEIIQEINGWADCIYLDFNKAFDRVLHSRLLWKVRKMVELLVIYFSGCRTF